MKQKLPNSKAKSELHVFDLDHTLIKANISQKFGAYLYREGLISFPKMVVLLSIYGAHRFGSLSLEQLHHSIFKRLFSGKEKEHFFQHVELFFQEIIPQFFYLPAISRLKEAQQQGSPIALFSSSPSFLVEPFAQHLKIEYVQSTQYEVDKHNQFSHVGNIINGDKKKEHLKALVARLNVDQNQVYAYSDHINDLPFLKQASHPVAVNADRRLLKIADINGWKSI